MQRKGIILAGGTGSRLHPMTLAVSKQLMPVYDKPMIYYPLSVLMLAGIRELLLISTPQDRPSFERLLQDGSQLGIGIQYATQPRPEGIAQALLIGRDFLGGSASALILGDNLFYGQGFRQMLATAVSQRQGATIFAYRVRDPQGYGIVEFDEGGRALSIEEKPDHPRSPFAIPGLYFYDERAPQFAAELSPSARGELEITDLNRRYLDLGDLRVCPFSRGFAWLDTGTPESLLQASQFVAAVEQRQGLKIACLEEIAVRQGFVSCAEMAARVANTDSSYGYYVREVLAELADGNTS